MTYAELKAYMHEYRMGRISELEMAVRIGLWQMNLTGGFIAIAGIKRPINKSML